MKLSQEIILLRTMTLTNKKIETMETKTITTEDLEQLKHRLAMVKDDLDIIRKFIHDEQLEKHFERPSETSDECWHNLNNIEIACDLSSEESLNWLLFQRLTEEA